MPNINSLIKCGNVKVLYNVINSNDENWHAIGKPYGKSLDRMFGSKYCVCTCLSLKGLTQQLKISKFYKDALFDWIDFRKTLQTHTTSLNPDTSLFGNSLITF